MVVPPRQGLPAGSEPESGADEALERSHLTYAYSFRTYAFRENLFAEFDRLVDEGKNFDGLIVDLTHTGYSLPLETFIKFHTYARRLLKPQGVLLFVKSDGAITLTRDDPAGGLTFNVYDSVFGIFARYPLLADYVCATISGVDRRRLRGGGSTLANHILYTSIPVLTEKGHRLKDAFELPAPQNWVLQLVDDYSTVEFVSKSMETQYRVPFDETLRILQELESESIIFPIFSRIQFLSNCYHNRKPFRLGRYLVAAGIVTPSQLEELLELQQEEGWGRAQRTMLGLLAVRRGFLNTRELEVLLHDQYLYGGYHKVAEGEDGASGKSLNIETIKDSMIGSLGAIDAAGLLQSLANAGKTGVLTVENRDKAIVVAFVDGKPTHATMNKLKGYDALTEFLVSWNEGIFVFRDKGAAGELDTSCALTRSLDRILLDSALYQDKTREIISALPGGKNCILERVWNFDALWQKASPDKFKSDDREPVTLEDVERFARLAALFDGWTTIDEVVKQAESYPGYQVIRAAQLLLEHGYVRLQQTSLFRPLTVFQRIAAEVEQICGPENNKALLEASLRYVHGSSGAAQRFQVDTDGKVSVNLAQVKKTGSSLSTVLLELRRWMEAYLGHCRREMDAALVNEVVAKVVHGSLHGSMR